MDRAFWNSWPNLLLLIHQERNLWLSSDMPHYWRGDEMDTFHVVSFGDRAIRPQEVPASEWVKVFSVESSTPQIFLYPGKYPCWMVNPQLVENHRLEADKRFWDPEYECLFCQHIIEHFPVKWMPENLDPRQHLHQFLLQVNEEDNPSLICADVSFDESFFEAARVRWQKNLQPFFHLLDRVDDDPPFDFCKHFDGYFADLEENKSSSTLSYPSTETMLQAPDPQHETPVQIAGESMDAYDSDHFNHSNSQGELVSLGELEDPFAEESVTYFPYPLISFDSTPTVLGQPESNYFSTLISRGELEDPFSRQPITSSAPYPLISFDSTPAVLGQPESNYFSTLISRGELEDPFSRQPITSSAPSPLISISSFPAALDHPESNYFSTLISQGELVDPFANQSTDYEPPLINLGSPGFADLSSARFSSFFGPLSPPQAPIFQLQQQDTRNVTANDGEDQQMAAETDGAMDSVLKKRSRSGTRAHPPMAIFIHAGAGYHSIQNENVHLAMCSKAASEAMKCLKAGGTAVEAVEAAIMVLENNDITNAGYGSNLSIDGVVECDATVVDHFGRSGACGAVPNIKNPISLAKLILDTSSRTLSLRRVPPNLLVGEGAKQFAMEHGMVTISNEELISRNARDRYVKWVCDLQKARGETRSTRTPITVSKGQATPPDEASPTERTKSQSRGQDQMSPLTKARKGLMRDHSSAILNGMWNEGQPDSPSADSSLPKGIDPATTEKKYRSPLSGRPNSTPRLGNGLCANSSKYLPVAPPAKRVKTLNDERSRLAQEESWSTVADAGDGAPSMDSFSGEDTSTNDCCDPRRGVDGVDNTALDATELTAGPNDADFDLITDTMGAIAIDANGNIAAASSSGGIGMKHMGRTGPAALVGIGTSVIPRDPLDPDERSVAAVTSGTGEHMATTMAAQKCAERLYHNTKRGPTGRDVPEEDSTGIMQCFIEKDFMGHPGVLNQASDSAIGVMAVEVTSRGIYVNWAHNTDSFALASFGSHEKTPATCMSRLPSGAKINIGARKFSKPPSAPDW